jgi:hypothetical protein
VKTSVVSKSQLHPPPVRALYADPIHRPCCPPIVSRIVVVVRSLSRRLDVVVVRSLIYVPFPPPVLEQVLWLEIATQRSCGASLCAPSVVMSVSKEVAVSYADMQIVLRARSPSFCRCAGGNCGAAVCDCTKAFSIAADCLKQVEGAFFVKLSRSNNSIRRLMCCMAQTNDRVSDDAIYRVLGGTTVIDDLVREREVAKRMVVANCSRELAMSMNKRWFRTKKWEATATQAPAVLNVMSPKVGDLPQVSLRILSASMKSSGPGTVFLALDTESFTWLANAICYQFSEGTLISSRRRKRQRTTDSDSNSSSSSDTDGDQVAEAPCASTDSPPENLSTTSTVSKQAAPPAPVPMPTAPVDVYTSAMTTPFSTTASSSSWDSSPTNAALRPPAPATADKKQLRLADMFQRQR